MFSSHFNSVISQLKKINGGPLTITLPNQHTIECGENSKELTGPSIAVEVKNWSVFKSILRRGDIGLAESYMAGYWDTNNLEGVLRLAASNRNTLEPLIYGSAIGSFLYKIRHFFRRNTRSGSKKNIHAHYDLGNAFYGLWLDPSMMYSSALFYGDDSKSLEEAQQEKINRILHELNCEPNNHILEIGCGWGGFMDACLKQEMQVSGLTISNAQKDFIDQKLSKKSSDNTNVNAEVLLLDYRDCHYQFDGIASIEMFEAVGEAYWPKYFETIYRCLKPGKRAVIQTIVIQDQLFQKYRENTDFIQQYIFPGGMLPSPSAFKNGAAAADLKVINELSFGPGYAKTLRIWRENFNQKLPEILQLGFDEKFIRMWNFYLMYCAAGFAEKDIDVVQYTLEKPSQNA
jgi:cyclopropane-fatty-acyl-phospholipid synthase